MSVSKYKFVSPGIFVKEVDNSALPATPTQIGPLVIGRTRRGPGMRPVQVNSFAEFVDIFGDPSPGGEGLSDVWRNNAILAPTYAAYAAQAWLANNSPINVVRLLGNQSSDATTAGQAGWMTAEVATPGTETVPGKTLAKGGAYGLFLMASSSNQVLMQNATVANKCIIASKDTSPATGTLAAVFYLDQGSLALYGAPRGGTLSANATASNATLIQSLGPNHEFQIQIRNVTGGLTDKINFNFDRNSNKWIRKVFNTNPALCNTGTNLSASQKNFWLGETYERMVLQGNGGDAKGNANANGLYAGVGGGTAAGDSYGMLVALQSTKGAVTTDWSNHRYSSQAAQTGWVIAQNLGNYSTYNPYTVPKLFKVHALKAGDWDMHNLKISITDISKSKSNIDPYGTFTLLVRRVEDTDGKMEIVERFSNCNLNPNSPNFVARKVGDKYVEFSSTERRNIEYGQYNNQSKFIRIEANQDLEAGALDSSLLPWGYFGPPRPKAFSLVSSTGSNFSHATTTASVMPFNFSDFGTSNGSGIQGSGSAYAEVAALAKASIIAAGPGTTTDVSALNVINLGLGTAVSSTFIGTPFTGAFIYPGLPLRSSSADGDLKDKTQAFFGLSTTRSPSSRLFEGSVKDLVRPLPETLAASTFATDLGTDTQLEYQHIFTLDDVVSGSNGKITGTGDAEYKSGSCKSGASLASTATAINAKTGYEAVLEYSINKFTMPLFGGFDGLNIKEKDPFRNTGMPAAATELNNYAFNSVKEAIDMVSDTETLDYNVAMIPGIYQKTLTSHLLDTCEDRADAMAIIDLEGDFKPEAENNQSFKARIDNTSVSTTVNNLRDRNINSSYGAAYFPWVQIKDTISDRLVFVPPSVAALGTISNSQNKSELWFAPAGFNRGGLSQGAAGLPVIGITKKLTSEHRDDLYEANVNPIASFPAEGIVVFGQKTLQATPSALDRINVRRLMIFLKKAISGIASGILFDQNVQVTWNRFTGQVEPFLRNVQTGLGLTDFKVILDSSTTTPDLVDRNILYAKIFLKPARAIEYIAIDFNISREGAAFAD